MSSIGQAKDSLWSIDFFRCESLRLKTHWVLVVMDRCTRRIIGFGIHPAPAMDGRALCRLFHQAPSPIGSPHCLRSDHDPVFRFHQWQANLRILGIHEVKTLPCVPASHPLIEQLIRYQWPHDEEFAMHKLLHRDFYVWRYPFFQ